MILVYLSLAILLLAYVFFKETIFSQLTAVSSIAFENGSTVGNITIRTCTFATAAGGTGMNLIGTGAALKGTVEGGFFIGAGTSTGGFDQTSNEWIFTDVFGVPDSGANGISSVLNNAGVIVTISGVNVWTDIDDGASSLIWSQSLGAEKFTLTDTSNGEQTYNGTRSRNFKFGGSITIEGTGGTDTVEVGISINGSAPTDATITSGIITNTQRDSITIATAPIAMVTSDTCKIQVRNTTDASDVEIFQARSVVSF